MNIQLANSDDEILNCFDVMHELRPDLVEEEFVILVQGLQQDGYHLAYGVVSENGTESVVAVAGFHIGHSLAWKKFLYVDDLVTRSSQRSKGYGEKMLAWLNHFAAISECQQLHLDSGVQREDAHRFYEREGMTRSGYHFAKYVDKPA